MSLCCCNRSGTTQRMRNMHSCITHTPRAWQFLYLYLLLALSLILSLSRFSLIEKCHIVRKSTLNRDGAHPPLIAHYNIPISCTSIGQLHLHLSHIPMDNYIICKHSPRPTPNMLKPHNSSSCFSECPQFIVYYYLPFVCCCFSFCFYCYYSLFFCWRCKINYLACALIVRAIKQTRHNAVNWPHLFHIPPLLSPSHLSLCVCMLQLNKCWHCNSICSTRTPIKASSCAR